MPSPFSRKSNSNNVSHREQWINDVLSMGISEGCIDRFKMSLSSDKRHFAFVCEYPPSITYAENGSSQVVTPQISRLRLLPSAQKNNPNLLRYVNPDSDHLPNGKMPLFYCADYAQLSDDVNTHGGKLYLFEGPSDTWAAFSMGIDNCSSFIQSGGSDLGEMEKQLIDLGVKSIDFFPDLDFAGQSGTYRIVEHFTQSGNIRIRVKHLPHEYNGVQIKDVRSLLVAVGNPEKTRKLLDACPIIDYEFSSSMRDAGLPKNTLYSNIVWKSEIEDIIADKLGFSKSDYKQNGWSKNIPCPFVEHEHDDHAPAFGWNRRKHFGWCYKCARSYSIFDLCNLFNLNWRDYVEKQDESANAQNIVNSSYETYKSGKLQSNRPKKRSKYLHEVVDERRPRITGDMLSPYPPIINPIPVIHKWGGFASLISRPRLVGIFAPSGGFKTSFSSWAISNLARMGEHGIVYSPEWSADEFGDRFIQMHGGLSFLELQKLDRYYHEQALSRSGKFPIDYTMRGEKPSELRFHQDELVSEQLKRNFHGKIKIIDGFYPSLYELMMKIEEDANDMIEDGNPPSWVFIDYIQLVKAPLGAGGYWKLDDSIDALKAMIFERGMVGFFTAQVRKADAEKARSVDKPEIIQTTAGSGFSDYPFNLIVTILSSADWVVPVNGLDYRLIKVMVAKNSMGMQCQSLDEADTVYVDTTTMKMYEDKRAIDEDVPFYQLPMDVEF